MNLQPTLQNELVRIRPLIVQDMEVLYEVAKDPLIWEQHPCKRYMRSEFEKFFQESIASKGALAIIDTATNAIIGSSRFKTFDDFPTMVEIGWTFLSRKYWGGMYNKAIKKLMMTHAFVHMDTILLFVAKDNIRSQKAVEKINGQKAKSPEYENLPRTTSDTIIFHIKKSEFINQ